MKQVLLSTLFAFTVLSQLCAQLSLQAGDYFPAIGDTLRIAFDNSPTGVAITAPGGGQVWNFSSLTSDGTLTRVVRPAAAGEAADSYPSANIVFDQGGGGEGYYLSDNSAFAIIGYAGTDPLGLGFEVSAPFTTPYVERWGDLNFFDLNNHTSALTIALATSDIPGNIFSGLPIAPDSVRVRVATTRTDLVDGWGTLTIPGGTYNVLREKRTEYREVRLDARAGPFPWVDITDLALGNLPIPQLGIDTLVTYSFWSDTAKEPVAVVNMDNAGVEVESVEFKFNDVISSTTRAIVRSPKILAYPNPAMVQAHFEFSNIPTGRYELALYDLTGKRLLQRTYHISGKQTESVGVAHLPKGIYLYALTDAQGKKVVVNRLVVVKP